MDLTTKKQSSVEERLDYEQLLIKKYRAFSDLCSDAGLKLKCGKIADRHQQHYDALSENAPQS